MEIEHVTKPMNALDLVISRISRIVYTYENTQNAERSDLRLKDPTSPKLNLERARTKRAVSSLSKISRNRSDYSYYYLLFNAVRRITAKPSANCNLREYQEQRNRTMNTTKVQ